MASGLGRGVEGGYSKLTLASVTMSVLAGSSSSTSSMKSRAFKRSKVELTTRCGWYIMSGSKIHEIEPVGSYTTMPK